MEWTRQRGPKGGVYCFYDIKQAYDSCSWDILRETMIREHWGIQAVDFLMARLQLSIRVRDPGTGILSEPVVKTGGTPQGEPISPTMFLVYMAPIIETMRVERERKTAAET